MPAPVRTPSRWSVACAAALSSPLFPSPVEQGGHVSQQRAPRLPETEKGDTRKKPKGTTSEEMGNERNGILEQILWIQRLA